MSKFKYSYALIEVGTGKVMSTLETRDWARIMKGDYEHTYGCKVKIVQSKYQLIDQKFIR
jgi:hypothetical protein